MMGEAEKAVNAIEEITGQPVSWPTIIAAICVIAAILLWAYKQIFPIVKARMENAVKKQMAEKEEKEKLETIEKKQEQLDIQFGQMAGMMKNLTEGMDKVSQQLNGISGENKLTLSVLLDMIECMQNKTSPEECAKLAQSNINNYYRDGQLPSAMIH